MATTLSTIDPDTISKINELTPLARKARRQHIPTDPKVLASKELTRLFKSLLEDGHTISEIAKVAEMAYHSVLARVKSE